VKIFYSYAFAILFLSAALMAQDYPAQPSQSPPMGGMAGMQGEHGAKPASLASRIEEHSSSGTDVQPGSTPSEMVMAQKGRWMLMFHGELFLNAFQQTGGRGADKFFSTNWFMPMAQRKFGKGTLTLRTMLSLEPATVSHRYYPELFQQGETAYGRPIVDGQHPHDFFMEIAGLYDYKVSGRTTLSLYAAPMGDPAMGPPAYPHRASAAEDPIAPLGHHLQDSTHIASDVVTVGVTFDKFRVEASAFHGREPDEYRWNINSGGIDSWSTRVTMNPTQNWSFQYSIAQLHSPESLAPAADIRRMTASLMYNRRLSSGNLAALLLWGRNQGLEDGNVGNSYLGESTLHFGGRNNAWMRVESADRTNELLVGNSVLPSGFSERYFARVQAYTAGYDREFGNLPHLSTALGGQMTWYGMPAVLRSTYGSRPVSALIFLRVRLH